MKIYLATWLLEESQGLSLSAVKNKRRLLSFFHLLQKIEVFKNYVMTGKNK